MRKICQALKGVWKRRVMKAGLDEDEKIPSVNSTYLRERHIDSADAK